MPVSTTKELWKLIIDTGLLARETCEKLHLQFQQANPNGGPNELAKSLIKSGNLSVYQARCLLSGKPSRLTIGDYSISDQLGEGPMAGTLVATHRPTGHPVWLHPIPSDIVQDAVRWSIVQKMCQLRSEAPHPHLIRCFHIRQGSKRSHLVTEQLDGNLLEESRPDEGTPIPVEDCARLGRQAAIGASHLHEQGMVIGQFTIGSLWLEDTGNLKLLHLPLRPVEPIDWTSDADGKKLALAHVAAPELAKAGAVPTMASDLYALGVWLFELLNGTPVFHGDIQQLLQQHATGEIPQPPFLRPELLQVINCLLAKSPMGRYRSASDVAEALRPFVAPQHLVPPAVSIPPTLPKYLESLRLQTAQTPPPVAVPPMPQPSPGAPVPGPPQPGPPQPMAAPPQPGGPPMPEAPMPVPAPMPPSPVPAPQPAAVAPVATAPVTPGAVGTQSRATGLAERVRKRKVQRKITALAVLGVMAIVALVGGIYGYQIVFTSQDDVVVVDPVPVPPTPDPNVPVEMNDPKPETVVDAGPKVVDDDGQTLWVSPTSGDPIDLTGLPKDTRFAMVVRMDELVGNPEGDRMLRALGPEANGVIEKLMTDLKLQLASIRTLALAHGPSSLAKRPTVRITLKSPTDLPSLWGSSADPQSVMQVGSWSALVVPGDGDTQFVVGESDVVAEIKESNFETPLLTRELEQIRRSSDDQRTVNILFDPQFLLGNADQILTGQLSALKSPLRQYLGEGVRGALFGGDLDSQLYMELRAIGSLSVEPNVLANGLKQRINDFSRQLEDGVRDLNPTSYWQRLAFRMPQMVGFTYRNARTGVSDNQSVVNVYLPASAGQNLVAGAELLSAATTSSASAAPSEMAGTSNEPKTIEDKLQRSLSISFPQNSLELAIYDIAEEAGFEFEIKGGDLQLDGITRNKEIKDFHHENKPAGEILAQLLVRANPEASPGAATDVQKLIYVVHPQDGPDDEKKVLVTTRKAAEKNNYTLPQAFQIP